MKNVLFNTALLLLLISSCSKTAIDPNQRVFGIFEVMDDKETVYMEGEIGSKTLQNFNQLIATHPGIKLIEIYECPGSNDDEINLELSQIVHNLGINTHLLDSGLIASGGVDFFLAGVSRTKGDPVWVGVHSWADGSSEATDYPMGHPFHIEFIDYYKGVGFTQSEAEDFYYFTINAASANSIHWMTEQELLQYNIFN